MTSRTTRRPATALLGGAAGRAAGTWVVTAVLFSTFVDAEDAHTHPLATGSWLVAVALSGIFVAAWVTRDFTQFTGRDLVLTWAMALVAVAIALALAALLTDTERSRSAGTDVASAVETSLLVAAGLALFAGLGLLVGRAVAESTANRS